MKSWCHIPSYHRCYPWVCILMQWRKIIGKFLFGSLKPFHFNLLKKSIPSTGFGEISLLIRYEWNCGSWKLSVGLEFPAVIIECRLLPSIVCWSCKTVLCYHNAVLQFCVFCADVVRVYDGNSSFKRRQYRTVSVPKHAPVEVLLVRYLDEIRCTSARSVSSFLVN